MSRVFTKDGNHIPVSVVKVPRNVIVRIKDNKDYKSLVVGYAEQKESRLNKAYKGQFKDGVKPTRFLKEVKANLESEYKVGDEIKVSDFEEGKKVDVTGISKGKGTQGNIKRHGHRRGPMSHGSKHKRLVGALAGASYPGRVFKGNKGPGRMGRDTVTIQGLPIVKIYEDKELILIKGAIPGNNDSMVKIAYSVKGGEYKYELLEPTTNTTSSVIAD